MLSNLSPHPYSSPSVLVPRFSSTFITLRGANILNKLAEARYDDGQQYATKKVVFPAFGIMCLLEGRSLQNGAGPKGSHQ